MGIQINGNNDIISALDGSWTAEGASINTSGILTATTFKGNIVGTAATFTGPVTIGGTLTYEDVTNIDSVGIVTARSTIDAQGDVSIADKIIHTGDTNTALRFPAADTITAETGGSERLRIDSNGWQSGHTAYQTVGINTFASWARTGGAIRGEVGYNAVTLDYMYFGTGTLHPVALRTNNTTALLIDNNQKIGIKNTSPSSQYFNNLVVGDNTAADSGITIRTNSGNKGVLAFSDTDSADANRYDGYIAYEHNNQAMAFYAAGANERLRIDNAGRLLAKGATDGMAFSGGNSLIIGNATSGTRTGITLVSASNTDSGVYFSRGTSSNSDYVKGQLVYNHPNDYFAIYTSGSGIRLKIDGLGGHNFYNDNSFASANLAECNDDKVAINIRKTRNGQTKGIAIGAIGTNSQTGLQAYDSSNNSANAFVLNPYGGYLGIGLGAGNNPDELLHIRSATTTAPIFEIVHETGGTAYKGQIAMRGNDLEIRGSSGQMEFYTGNVDGASSTERMRIKDDGKLGISQGANIPNTAVHILDNHTSSWDSALTKDRAVLRLETHWNAQAGRAIGDYGSGIVFNHLGGHSATHNDDIHAWLGLRIWDTPGYERSALVFATNDQTGSESTHDAGCKERLSISPYGQVVINSPTNNNMTSTSHAKLWVEADGINVASDWDPGDNQGSQPHFTLSGMNSHVRLDMGTMDVAPYGGYIQARYDNTPDTGATNSDDGLEPLMLQPRGGATTFNFAASTTMPNQFDPDSPYGPIRIRSGRANSTSVSEANTAIKIWPAEERVHSGQIGDADQGTKYGGIGWLVLDPQSQGGWSGQDGNQCWMGMSLHSTPGQELANWQLRMNSSGTANTVANNIALQASPQGWVTKPSHPVFLAHHNNGTRITGTGYVTFGDQIEDNGGDNYNNSNGRFTAPIGGYYYIFCKVNTWKRIDIQIRINGSTDHTHREIGQFNTSNDAEGWFSHNVVRIFRMETDEYAQVYVSSLTQQTDPGEWCTFGGYLIG